MGVVMYETDHTDTTEYGGELEFLHGIGAADWWRENTITCPCANSFSPAPNSVVTKIIPAMVVSGIYSVKHILGCLDISDAYLQVPQEDERRLRVVNSDWKSLLICDVFQGSEMEVVDGMTSLLPS